MIAWIRSCLAKFLINEPQVIPTEQLPPTPAKINNGKADFFKDYYSLAAEGARLKLIESMFGLNLFSLFENKEIVLETEIIEGLRLMPLRAQKWLNLLSYEKFLIKLKVNNKPAYKLPEGFLQQMSNGPGWLTMKYFIFSCIEVSKVDLADLLKTGASSIPYSWPPQTQKEAAQLEQWMQDTSSWTTNCLLEQIDFNNISNLLDVGGGDGTMACAIVSAYPHLKATVYNLPESAEIARKNIESKGLSHRVSVIEGNFLEDEALPVGFDFILFARVMWDWGDATNKKLIKMAYQALQKNALVAICEVFKDDNNDFCLALEYRHLFYDVFDANLMKTSAEYKTMLEKIGFTVLPRKVDPVSSLSVLMAKK